LERWLPRWAAEAVAVPLAAQLATQPLVSWLSGAVSLSGLLANALAGPWVAPATVVGLVTALVASVLPVIGALIGCVGAWLVEPILQIAHRCAALPGAAQPWPVTPLGLTVLGAACLFVAWVMPRVLGRAWLVTVVALALVAGLLQAPLQPGWPPSNWQVVVCDVGQGDAVAVKVGDGQAVLFDTGPPQAGLGACLLGLGVHRVPLVVISHFHADHVGGLAELLDGWPVGALLVNETVTAGAVLALAQADAHDVPVQVARAAERFTVGPAVVEVLSPVPGPRAGAQDSEESSAENDQSLVTRIEVAGLSLLATGDLEESGQKAVLRLVEGRALRVNLLKVPHHGSARQDEAFLAATGARIALIGVGAENTYGHPAVSTVNRLTRLGMAVARTDEHGAIAVTLRAGELVLVSQR
jgi:competence protein ComEC